MSIEAGKRLFTADEFHRMGEAGIFGPDERVELLGGEIVEMPPIGWGHSGGVAYLGESLTRGLGDRALIWVRLPVRLDDLSEPVPDVTVLRRRDDYYRGGPVRPSDVLLLIEVADSSIRRDRKDKLPRYAAAGIAEVWIVDLQAERVEIYREPRGTGYGSVTIAGRGDRISPEAFPDLLGEAGAIFG